MTKHKGGCHCGKVAYEVELDLSQPVISCNCSICSKRGSLLAFTTPDKFDLKSGEPGVADYQFNKHVIHHLFCPTCGILSYARGKNRDGSDAIAINVRCIEGVEIDKLKLHHHDGRST
jgi:hypothetical protein